MTPHETSRQEAILLFQNVLETHKLTTGELCDLLRIEKTTAVRLQSGSFASFDRQWLIKKAKLLKKVLQP